METLPCKPYDMYMYMCVPYYVYPILLCLVSASILDTTIASLLHIMVYAHNCPLSSHQDTGYYSYVCEEYEHVFLTFFCGQSLGQQSLSGVHYLLI